MRKTGLFVFALIFAFTFSSCGGNSSAADSTETSSEEDVVSVKVSETDAPTYDVPFPVWSQTEDLLNLFEQNNDSTYVINFWATWCKPCVKELPYFEQLHQEFKGEKVRVILVSIDFDTDVETKLKSFVEEHEMNSDVIAFINGDYNSWIGEVEEAWDGAIPVTIIYNAKDRKFFSGEMDSYEELSKVVEEMNKA